MFSSPIPPHRETPATSNQTVQRTNNPSDLPASISGVTNTSVSLPTSVSALQEKTVSPNTGNHATATEDIVLSHLKENPIVQSLIETLLPTYSGRVLTAGEICRVFEKIIYSESGVPKLDLAKKLQSILSEHDPDFSKKGISLILAGIIRKEEAELVLLNILPKHPDFASFNEKNIWHLVMDPEQQQTRGPYGFENEPGNGSAMYLTFAHLLNNENYKEPLTAQTLCELHDKAVEGVYINPKVMDSPVI